MNKYKMIGIVVHSVYRFLSLISKKEYYYHKNARPKETNIVVFWHQKIFSVCNATKIITKKASITSASNDGEIISEILRRENNKIIRGSSSRDNVKSLKEAMKYAKNGYTLGIAIDGPRGPIFEPKPGAVFIAKKTGLPILPINSYTNKKWKLEKAWDKLQIPKPFSKTIHYMGEPFYISKDMEMDSAIELIKQKINETGNKAYEIYCEKYLKK